MWLGDSQSPYILGGPLRFLRPVAVDVGHHVADAVGQSRISSDFVGLFACGTGIAVPDQPSGLLLRDRDRVQRKALIVPHKLPSLSRSLAEDALRRICFYGRNTQ